jgi:integrase
MGVNALVVRDRLGHEDIQTTLGIYGHLYPNTNKEVAERLSNMISIPKNGAKRKLIGNQYVKRKG